MLKFIFDNCLFYSLQEKKNFENFFGCVCFLMVLKTFSFLHKDFLPALFYLCDKKVFEMGIPSDITSGLLSDKLVSSCLKTVRWQASDQRFKDSGFWNSCTLKLVFSCNACYRPSLPSKLPVHCLFLCPSIPAISLFTYSNQKALMSFFSTPLPFFLSPLRYWWTLQGWPEGVELG